MVHTENGCTNKQIKLATIVIHIKYDFLSFIRLLPLVTRARATTFWKKHFHLNAFICFVSHLQINVRALRILCM